MEPASIFDTLAEGIALHRTGRLNEAAERYRSLLAGPLALDALINLGALSDQAGRPAEALSYYRHALSFAPDNSLAHFNLGNSLMKLGRFAEAARSFRSALAADPALAAARLALGSALQGDGDLAGAIATFREALTLDPGHAEAHWYLALALLSAGELSEGWREYEWRWRKESFSSPRRGFTQPLWDGSPLAGRRILVHAEQGLGDTIHFIRYAPLVAAAGGTVIVECQHRSLRPILERIPGISRVAVMGEELPPFEVQIPLLSLPDVFGTTLATIPHAVPYLDADPQRLENWRRRIAGDAGFKVGIVWAGKPFPDPFRSATLADLAPLAALPEVSFYSLQLGGEGGDPPAGMSLTDLTSEIRDFGDTAALITLLDLVISVDTSVAHLAGALGKPVYVMLPKACDWRWLRERDDSPWYPTMRLFRQQEQGRWQEVVQAIAGALKGALWEFLEGKALREPFNADRFYACGVFLAEEGRHREATVRFTKATIVKPGFWEAHYSLGVSLQHLGLLSQAAQSFREGIAVADRVALLHEALGVLLQMQGDLEGARASYRRALELDPEALRPRYNLGTVCRDLGLFAEALAIFEEVVRRAPAHGDARWNRAVLMLVHGDLASGWQEFSWRFRKSTSPPERSFPHSRRWDGSELAGRTILLYAEQGLGDTLQFVRYAPLVASQGGRVILEVQNAGLIPLVRHLAGVESVLVAGDPLPGFELHASLMDLPALFGTTLASVPPAPYLAVDQSLRERWRALVGGDASFKVGLVWSGNPRHENDANRSLKLEALAPLAAVAGVTFYSLQVKGASQAGAPSDAPFPLRDLTPSVGDFADTAALASNLDLVLTVDTSVAHLCGALGVPVWVLIPLVPDWRWLLDREDSPWYPSMRLFRQTRRGDWPGVVERVRRELASLSALPVGTGTSLSPLPPGEGGRRPGEGETPMPPAVPGHPSSAPSGHLLPEGAGRSSSLFPQEGKNRRLAEAHKDRALALSERGAYREAAEAFETALALDPLDPETLNNLGSALACQGRHLEGIARYLKAISLKADFVAPHYNMANSLKLLGRTAEAMESYRRALALDPRLVQGWHNLALAQRSTGQHEEARRSLQEALRIKPDYLEALHSLGELHFDAGEVEEAKESFLRALQFDPGYLPSLNAMGMALQTQARPQQALAFYERALAIDPDYLHALNNLGLAFKSLGQLKASAACYSKVIELNPEYADAYWNLGLVLLLLGEYREGWRLYEWRFSKVEPIVARQLPQPLWDGSPLAGRSILMHAEQGFGDAIQFVRYATVLAGMGAEVFVECQVPALKPLLATVPGVAGVVARGEPLPSFEVHAPFMSLPHLCGTTLETIPARIPYLSADPGLKVLWREKAAGGGGLKVGLVWAGRKTYKDDKKRSLSLSLFAPLAKVPGVRFFMLQMGSGSEQAADPPQGMELCDLTGGIRDFGDTAALISNLDLVISADTAVAHLTGGLGKPVWVLVPFACDWRWLVSREDSPWYPTARLFRQSEPGDWPGVLNRVADALCEISAGKFGDAPPSDLSGRSHRSDIMRRGVA